MPADAGARLRDFIAEADLPPGSRLPAERELAARLGVSRPALREATTRLAQWGVVTAVPKSGTYLAPLQLEDLLEVRVRLEPLAARHAATRRTSDELDEMRRLLARMRARRADPIAFAAADAQLHASIAAASRNSVLQEVLRGLYEVALIARRTTATSAAVRKATAADMADLVAHVASRDGAAAEAAMHRHLSAIAEAARSGQTS